MGGSVETVYPPRCKNTKLLDNATLKQKKMKKLKSILKKIRDAIICIIVTPAAVIHIAYQVWYFREYLNSLAAKPSEKRGEEGDK